MPRIYFDMGNNIRRDERISQGMAGNIGEKNIKHTIMLSGREELKVSGVNDVINFDETCIVLETVAGILSIDGQNLHIVNLNVDSGDVSVSGEVNGIIYPQSLSKSGGLFRRKK